MVAETSMLIQCPPMLPHPRSAVSARIPLLYNGISIFLIPQAFMKGATPRLIHKIPANAFFFVFYELFRNMLGVKR